MRFLISLSILFNFQAHARQVYCEGWPKGDETKIVREIYGEVISASSDFLTIKASVKGRPKEDGFYILKSSQCMDIADAEIEEASKIETNTIDILEKDKIQINTVQANVNDQAKITKDSENDKIIAENAIADKTITTSSRTELIAETKNTPNIIPLKKRYSNRHKTTLIRTGYDSSLVGKLKKEPPSVLAMLLFPIIPITMLLSLRLLRLRKKKS